jgi:hypothetical protein
MTRTLGVSDRMRRLVTVLLRTRVRCGSSIPWVVELRQRSGVFLVVIELIYVVAICAAALCIGLYATWLLVYRLRAGESEAKSFREWIKHSLEAIWGL